MFTGWIYAEFNGYPWEHAQVKKEAVDYMKRKYNMDVEVVGSSFNFKFDNYTAKLYNINDTDKSIIRVEKNRVYDQNRQTWEKRLEDNYCMVYWEKRINEEVREKYPDFCNHNDIEKINVDISYSTTPLEEGVSRDEDENGVIIPLKPELAGILDVDLKIRDFSESLLNELLLLINALKADQLKIDLFITGKREDVGNGDSKARTKLINIECDSFKEINSAGDLKKMITDF